jgi:hypothetical protein
MLNRNPFQTVKKTAVCCLLRIEAPMPPFLCNEDECLALSERLVDGEENPIAVIYLNKFDEVQNTSG